MGIESREADGCPSFLEKRDRRERSSHSARRLPPQRHRVRALRPNNRRNDRVCHRVSNNEDTDPHTISNALLVLAMINKGKLYSYQNARFFKQTSQWRRKKRMMYSPGRPYIVVAPVVTSWAVAGQRMVFFHMFLQARVTLEAFPIVSPRGRSSKFPWRGTGIHPWREHLSKLPDGIKCEHDIVRWRTAVRSKRRRQFVQKLFGYVNRLLQQLSGWLVSDDLGGEDAGCEGPGLVWLHVVCGCEAGWMYCQILWNAFGDGLW